MILAPVAAERNTKNAVVREEYSKPESSFGLPAADLATLPRKGRYSSRFFTSVAKYVFPHLSFEEYLVALYLLQQPAAVQASGRFPNFSGWRLGDGARPDPEARDDERWPATAGPLAIAE